MGGCCTVGEKIVERTEWKRTLGRSEREKYDNYKLYFRRDRF